MATKHKRRMRNYLLDRSFQLKYAGLLFGVAAILSAALGMLLWNESQMLITQSKTAVESGQHAVALGKQVSAERKKVTDMLRMNIVKDEMYADSPELLEELDAENKEEDAKVAAQEKELEEKASALAQQATELEAQQQAMFYVLFGVLTILALVMGFLGIVVTHKVAGPIFKMTRQIRAITDGDWSMPHPLRKGDELAEFFGAFEKMVKSMRTQREHEIALLDGAIDKGEGLDDLRSEMGKVLAE